MIERLGIRHLQPTAALKSSGGDGMLRDNQSSPPGSLKTAISLSGSSTSVRISEELDTSPISRTRAYTSQKKFSKLIASMPSKQVCELQLVTETSINNHDLIV